MKLKDSLETKRKPETDKNIQIKTLNKIINNVFFILSIIIKSLK